MKLRYLLCTAAACVAMAGVAMAQMVSYPVAGESGCTTGAPVVVSGITASPLCRGGGILPNAGATSYNSTNFTVGADEAGAIAANDYLEFSVTPGIGIKATITDIVVNAQRSSTGPLSMSVRYSLDGYATTLASVINNIPTGAANRTLDVADFDTCAPVTFRIYAWGATNASGTFRAQGPSSAILVNGTAVTGTCGAPVTGACCIAGVCNTTTTQLDCTSLGGFYGGDGTSCPSFVCPAVGACCFPNGSCQFLTSANCTSQGGTYQSDNLPCANANCPQPVGGCCIAGICFGTDVTQVDCTGSGGTWLGAGVACVQGQNCIEPQAACCLPDGMCTVTTSTSCTGQGGIFIGTSATCTNIVCNYACCFADGTCTLTTLAACATAGGTQTANLSRTCSPNTCPQPTALGACCNGTTCTAAQSFADCNTAGGIWLGKGTTCTASICNQASDPALIAKYDFDVNRQATAFTITTDAPAPTGDAFGPVQRFRAWPEPVAFSLLDDSVTLFPFVDTANPGDNLGVIPESKVDTSFGVTDVFNIVITDSAREALAQWDFNITGRTVGSISVEIAAMGDFERAATCSTPPCVEDRYILTYEVDTNGEVTLFDARADEAADLTYTMAGGQMFLINDPLVDTISMTTLNNSFQTFTFNLSGVTGSVLKLRLRSQTDGGTEAFALDNIMIMEPATSPCTIANFDNTGDSMGVVDVVDLFAFLDAWFAQNGVCLSGCSADVAAPFGGTPDVTDLFDFLDAWFATNGQPCP